MRVFGQPMDPPDPRPRVSVLDAAAELAAGYPGLEKLLPPFRAWRDLGDSQAWFSAWHRRKPAFALPFWPGDFVYSPRVDLPIPPGARAGSAHYARGVRAYASAIARGEALPPITLVCSLRDGGRWFRMDGNHRWDAAVGAGLASIPAVFALPKALLPDPD